MSRQQHSTIPTRIPMILLLLVPLMMMEMRDTWAQKLPPAKYDGFLYKNHVGDPNTIKIEAFYDPVCPDSRDSWPPLKQILKFYGPSVSVVLHLLPLPYHDNAYVASRALHIANNLNTSSTFPLLEKFFKHQEKFYNAQTRNLSKDSVLEEIVSFVATSVGNSYYPAIKSAFDDRQTDLKTRVSFKELYQMSPSYLLLLSSSKMQYSTSKGVYGTPTFFVNGFILPDEGSPLDYNFWRSVIDPLIGSKSDGRGEDSVHML